MAVQLLKWTKNTPWSYRAYAPGGVYSIHRYAKTDTHPAFWAMDFYEFDAPEGQRVTTIEFLRPAEVWKHTLDHAKASCQRDANERLTARLEARFADQAVEGVQ